MVTKRDGDAGSRRRAGSGPEGRGAVEVINVAVHELRPGGGEGLEVRPVDVHELARPLRLVKVAAPSPGSARHDAGRDTSRAGEAEEAVVGTSALRLVPLPDPAPAAALATALAERVVPEPPVAERSSSEAPAIEGLAGATAGAGAGPSATALLDGPAQNDARRRRGPFAPWLWRRLWAVVLCLVAGIGGGYVATKGHHGGFSSQVLLEVRPGTTPANPGGAQEAGALAVTYAALVPSDTAVLTELAGRLGVPVGSLGGALSATAETGTGLFLVTFSAPSAAQAIAGANDVGSVLASAAPPGLAIVQRSIAVVRPATTAKAGKDLRMYGLVGGIVGGGLLGLVLLLVLERVDARVDDPEDAADTCGCPATRWPGDMSVRELAVALARTAPGVPLTLVPLSSAARGPAERLGSLLAASWPETGADSPAPAVVAYDESPATLSEGGGPAVVVVSRGERVRSLAATCSRLQLLDRRPAFAVVCERSGRRP